MKTFAHEIVDKDLYIPLHLRSPDIQVGTSYEVDWSKQQKTPGYKQQQKSSLYPSTKSLLNFTFI